MSKIASAPINALALGKRIAAARKRSGLTQAALAEKTGTTIQYISALECGKRTPSLDLLVLIAKICDTTADNLLCDTLGTEGAVYDAEVQGLLEGCSDKEKAFLVETMRSLKENLGN